MQDVTGRAVSLECKDAQHCSVLGGLDLMSLVLLITLPPTALCFSLLDAVGSHLNVADEAFVTKIKIKSHNPHPSQRGRVWSCWNH